ncbi:MAG: VOC family protein, partial [Clostridia bacterium]
MEYNSMIPELTVSDINQTKDFYINKLGFTLEYEREEDEFIFLSYNGSQFMFEQLHESGWNV